jgi:hypothetical protein
VTPRSPGGFVCPSSRFCWIQLVALPFQGLGGESRVGAGEQVGPAQADHRAATARPIQLAGVDPMAASDARVKAGKGFLGRRLNRSLPVMGTANDTVFQRAVGPRIIALCGTQRGFAAN